MPKKDTLRLTFYPRPKAKVIDFEVKYRDLDHLISILVKARYDLAEKHLLKPWGSKMETVLAMMEMPLRDKK